MARYVDIECDAVTEVLPRRAFKTRQDIQDFLDNIPTVDVTPVRHGRWIGCNGEIVDWDENNPGCPRHSCFCSICKSWLTASDEFPVIAYFCPNCGAKMDGGADND